MNQSIFAIVVIACSVLCAAENKASSKHVLIYATGGRKRGEPSGGIYVAFALP